MKILRKAKNKGLFISFEGGEGVGKTTQIARLAMRLEKAGHKVVVTREPGGSAIANRIRTLLLDRKNDGLVPLAELFLYEASRAQHLHDTIRPALARGEIVICDRFTDSSVVYQGTARKIKPSTVANLNLLATSGLQPQLTFILDLDPRIGLARVGSRGIMDRMEKEQLSFHKAVRRGYLKLVKAYPQRCKLIDASQSRDKIHEDICEHVF
jgi:dTMP kinase